MGRFEDLSRGRKRAREGVAVLLSNRLLVYLNSRVVCVVDGKKECLYCIDRKNQDRKRERFGRGVKWFVRSFELKRVGE